MDRSYYSALASDFANADGNAILGILTSRTPKLEENQRGAWVFQIKHLRDLALQIPKAHIFLEFTIPRMGRRADTVIVYCGLVFVLEYKVGKHQYIHEDINQTLGYALDLKNFHETSHHRRIIPILIATEAVDVPICAVFSHDGVSAPILANAAGLHNVIDVFVKRYGSDNIDAMHWEKGRYKPTPTIVEAAQALYRGHNVEEISRSESGAKNLTTTSAYINSVIELSKSQNQKTICFITGVPGSGKTLAGLNIAQSRMKAHADEHAVFLSGNGPLVDVLRDALTIDRLDQLRCAGEHRPSRREEYTKACAFIQNIHHFRDENLQSAFPPVEKVVVFDEAQRAWDVEQTSRFMREKRELVGFSMSEPEFLLSVMDRHPDWCTVVCLIGGGQEINTGEAGITEWLQALKKKFPHWRVHISDQLNGPNYLPIQEMTEFFSGDAISIAPALHLAVSLRSFRAERLSEFIGALIDGDISRARELFATLSDYPIRVTRNLSNARSWLRLNRRGMERAGLVASSNALRLKPEGIFMKAKIEPSMWFLAPHLDIRSSDALEDAGSEFDVQGLELDWICVCWDANLRWKETAWSMHRFQGTKWQKLNDVAKSRYLLNSYRVLLTRARQGMVIFVPEGNSEDSTRLPEYYDPIYKFLKSIGIETV
ncbi:DUF2075 domain-containing protein [Noviherbaspirillum sp. Root189]|uniref:DUF2075 domain-containing protein n=1 Tax=Noviherbaspirillum sp. Root189 TaxID=1736487 RepID=UPI00070BF953|nr:DUF2075 domain-containing protein [Noviherbaspirillum sp. Root189]KRB84525.1 hypothetical protein ASE07_03760 [Noviherbaspirillum sp. Root189]